MEGIKKYVEMSPSGSGTGKDATDHIIHIHAHETLELSAEDLELLERIASQSDRRSREDNISEVTKIQKVPIKLRQVNYEKYYEPKLISIGPIHHRNPKAAQTRELKEKLAAKFVHLSGKSGDHLLRKIKIRIEELQSRFDEEVIKSFDADFLARMLFVDGCSVLEFIHSYVHDELDEFDINNGEAALVQQDLLLLENQIPIDVLRLLMKQSEKRGELKNCVVDFVLMNGQVPADASTQRFLSDALIESDLDDHPIHLLDLLRSVMLFDGGDVTKRGNTMPIILRFQSLAPRRNNRSDMFRLSPKLRSPESSSLCFTIPLLGNKGALVNSPNHLPDRMATDSRLQDLKAAGVILKPSQTGSLRDISFKAPYFARGQIELPPLNVDDAATLRLWNLVAFEMCPDNYDTDGGVSSYLSFLDSLVIDEGDVRDLRSARILGNSRNSDAEVARTIREIGAQIFDQLGYSRAYTGVTSRILKHMESGCSTRCAIWKADFYREHFRSPWTVLALIAAVIVLVLTGIQTWFTINPRSNS